MIAAGTEDWKKVFHGVLTFNRSWRPLRPVMIEQAKYDELARVMDRLLQLILETGMRRATTAGELRKLLGTPDGLIEYLDDDEVLGEHLVQSGRPDVLITDGVPKFVEFNIGSEVGCVWDTEKVSTRFLEMFTDRGLELQVPVVAPPSPIDGRYRAMIDYLGLEPGDRLTMVMRTDGEYPGNDDIPATGPDARSVRGARSGAWHRHGLRADPMAVAGRGRAAEPRRPAGEVGLPALRLHRHAAELRPGSTEGRGEGR